MTLCAGCIMINMSKTFDIISIQKGCMGMNTGLIFFAAFIITLVLEVIGSLANRQEMAVNPFVKLCAMALIYFAFLLFFQKKHGG